MPDHAALADRMADRVSGRAPWLDILEDEPGLTDEDAYAVQFRLMDRLVAEGDAIAGYKAAYTSLAMQKARGTGGPIAGAFLRSAVVSESDPLPLVADSRNAVEPEVAILLGSDLTGSNITPHDMLGATACLLPALEVAVGAPGNLQRSRQMVIATHKTFGSVILGGPGWSPVGIDLRTEGVVVSLNDEVHASATAVEVLGNPWIAAAFIANTVLRYGGILRAGMVLMTGSIIAAHPCVAGDRVTAEFSRLGRVGVKFAEAG